VLLGEQNTGKSLFWKRLVQIVMNDRGANVESYQFGTDKVHLLRRITGNSIFMGCSEMSGFNSAEMSNIKDFFTETCDTFDDKFEHPRNVQRRWVIVGTGNEYRGFQRDTTGNRRIMPYFVNQAFGKPYKDPDNEPDDEPEKPLSEWKKEPFRARFDNDRLDDEIMQVMAECQKWFAENDTHGYETVVADAIRAVSEFSESEMTKDSGTVPCDALDSYLLKALYYVHITIGKNNNWEEKAVCMLESEIMENINTFSKNSRINSKLLANKMKALGAEIRKPGLNGYKTWAFRKFSSTEVFRRHLLKVMNKTDEYMQQRYGWMLFKNSTQSGLPDGKGY
jgi:hypothetical protein